MSNNSFKEHADQLKKLDRDKYNAFVAEMALQGHEPFLRETLLRKPDYNLKKVPFIVQVVVRKYFPQFTERHFLENVLPELPEVPKLEAA